MLDDEPGDVNATVDENKILKRNTTFNVRGGEEDEERVSLVEENEPYARNPAESSETASLNPKNSPKAKGDESKKRTMTLLPLISLIFFSVAGGARGLHFLSRI